MDRHDPYEILRVPPGTSPERIREIHQQAVGEETPERIAAASPEERPARLIRLVELAAMRDQLLEPGRQKEHDSIRLEVKKRRDELKTLEQALEKKKQSGQVEAGQDTDRIKTDLDLLQAHWRRLYHLALRLAAGELLGPRRAGGLGGEASEALDRAWIEDFAPEGEESRLAELRPVIRALADRPLPAMEEALPELEPVEPTAAEPDLEGPELRAELLATVLHRGDLRLMDRLATARSLEPPGDWTVYLDPHRGEDREFVETRKRIDREALAEPERIEEARWLAVVRALEKDRARDAAFGLDPLGLMDAVTALFLDEAADQMVQQEFDGAARLLIRGSEPELPFGPRPEELALQLHNGCPNPERGCLTDQPPEVIRLEGLGYLLGSRMWVGRLTALPEPVQAELFRSVARLRTPDLEGFLERYDRQVGRYLELREAPEEERLESLQQLGPELLGWELQQPRYDLYLREIARRYPVAPLGLCMEALGSELALVPKVVEDQGLLRRLLER